MQNCKSEDVKYWQACYCAGFSVTPIARERKNKQTNKQQKQRQPAYPILSSDFTKRIYKSLLKPRHFELWPASLMSCWCNGSQMSFLSFSSPFFSARGVGGAWAGRVSPSSVPFFLALARVVRSFAARPARSPTKLRKCLSFTMWKHLVM